MIQGISKKDVNMARSNGKPVDIATDTKKGISNTKGHAKAWVHFNGTGTVLIHKSENVLGVTDYGPGNYGVNFDTDMLDGLYCVMASCDGRTSVAGFTPSVEDLTVSGFKIYTGRPVSGSNLNYNLIDCGHVFAVVYGDN